jgi:hypothetical protein
MLGKQAALAAKKIEPALPVRTVRGLLLLRGTSLAEWSRGRGWPDAFVHQAITGKRRGPTARKILSEIRDELGL